MNQSRHDQPGLWQTSITPALIAQHPGFSMPLISPDGESIAWVRSFDGRSDLWIAATSGGSAKIVSEDQATISGSPSAPFGGGYGSWFGWTPDSSGLVFTAAADGQLYQVSTMGSPAIQLTDDPGKHLNPSLLPDGKSLVCVVDRGDVDGEIFIGRYELESSPANVERLTPQSVIALDPVSSPDGRSIACVTYRLRDRWAHHSHIAVIDLESGSVSDLTPTDNIINCRPRWSPGGSMLGFISDRSGFLNVYTIPATGGGAIPVAPESFEQNEFNWSDDGSHIVYLRNHNAEISIHIIDLKTNQHRQESKQRGVYRELSWSGSRIVALHQSSVQPTSVVVIDCESNSETVVATSAIAGLDHPDQFVMPEHVSWQSSDGLEIPGLLFIPNRESDAGYPVLIHLHGGPTAQSLMGWDPLIQYFVARGWVVVQPNYRGSTGYGREFADKLHGVWGLSDVEDNVASLTMLRDRQLLTDDRCVIWGGSAGGYGVLTCLTMQPEAFMAGVDLYGISDWPGMRRDGDRYVQFLADSELGPEETSRELWIERSPVTNVERITKPLLVLQGTADPRVPKAQSDAMVAAMQKAGKHVEYHIYEGEPHGWQRRANIEDYIVKMECFLIEQVLS